MKVLLRLAVLGLAFCIWFMVLALILDRLVPAGSKASAGKTLGPLAVFVALLAAILSTNFIKKSLP